MSLSSAGCRPVSITSFVLPNTVCKRQGAGHVPGHSHIHPRVDQRLDEQEHVGRPAGAQGRCHVHVLLIGDIDLLAHARQHGLGHLTLGVRDARRAGPEGHPAAHLGRGVGHHPHHGAVVQPGRQRVHPRAGNDRQRRLVALQRALQFTQHGAQVLRLHRQHHEVGAGGGLEVVRHRRHPELGGEESPALGHRLTDRDVGRSGQLPRQHTVNDGLRHLAAADKR